MSIVIPNLIISTTLDASSVTSAPTFGQPLSITASSDQIALGSSSTITTITSPATGSARTYTLPDNATASGTIAVTGASIVFGVTPASVASANAEGTNGTFARSNHEHQGIHQLKATAGGTARFGDIILEQGTNMTITDSGGGTFTLTPKDFSFRGEYGSGIDGDVTISTPTTLAADMHYNNLTVSSILTTGGFRIFVANTLTMSSGTITRAGNAGVGITAGAALAAGSLGASFAGANGRSTAGVGTAAGAATANTSVGSAGGAGGAGSTNAGGAGGAISAPAATSGGAKVMDALPYAVMGRDSINTLLTGGTGGGGGGVLLPTGTGTSGGGGGGGGVMLIAARILTGTGIFTVSGGVGGIGVATLTASAGGGGGGGGGKMIVLSSTDITTTSITTTAAGGLGGVGVGTSSTGTNGTAGFVVTMVN